MVQSAAVRSRAALLVGMALLALPAARLGATCSKLSIHTGFTGSESATFIQTTQPTVVKLLGAFNQAASIKSWSPNTRVVGRIYEASQPQDGDAATRAQEWWTRNKATIQAYPSVDYWEGYNEPVVGTIAQIQWYAAFEKRRVQLLEENGRKACIGNFATGTPDVTNASAWPAFYPAIDAAKAAKGVLCVHEYSAPTMQSQFDTVSGEGWLTGRYRKVYRQYLQPSNRVIPLIITETGIDRGVVGSCGNPASCDGWTSYGYTASQYVDQLKWYDGILKQDAYVLGATIFQLEIPGWASFSIAGSARTTLQSYMTNSSQACLSGNWAEVNEAVSRVPRFMTPGQVKSITVRVKNQGTNTWSSSYAQPHRLGSTGANGVTWSGWPCGGYAVSPTNSRTYLCSTVAPGSDYNATFNITAPSTSTSLGVQMVQDGYQWFGEAQAFPITVANCGNSCTQCILDARPDVLAAYGSWGWSTACSNRDAIRNDWCANLDPNACNNLKNNRCQPECF